MQQFITKLLPYKTDILWNILAITLIVIFFLPLFYPHLSMFVTPEMGVSDLWQFNIPVKSLMADAIRGHYIPWWTDAIGTGFPILAESQMGFFNVFNLALYSAFPYLVAFNLEYILIYYVAFLGMYLFLRHLKSSSVASFLGAFAFAFSGFFITHISHQNMILSACYIPWIFLVVNLFFSTKKIRYLLVAVLLLSQQLFAGYMQIAFITWIFMGLYVLLDIHISKKQKNTHKNIWAMIVLGVLIVGALVISAVQVLPTFELIDHSIRKNGLTPSENIQYSYPVKHLITFLDPFLLGNPQTGTYPHYSKFDGSIFWENTGYIGLIPLAFALFSLLLFKKNKKILVFALLGFAAFLLMTGKHSPFYFIHTMPPFNKFRIPSRYIIMLIFSLCTLSAFGLDAVLERLQKWPQFNKYTRLVLLAIISISIVTVFYVWNGYHSIGLASKWLSKPDTAQFIASEKKDGRVFSTNGSSFWYEFIIKSKREKESDYVFYRNGLPHNYNILTGTDSIDAYVGKVNTNRQIAFTSVVWAGITKKGNNVLSIATESARLLGMASVRYATVSEEIDSPFFEKKYTTKNHALGLLPYSVFENLYYLPRARMVYSFTTASTLQSIQQKLLSSTFEPKNTAILERTISESFPKKCADNSSLCPSTVKVISSTKNSVTIHTNTAEKGLLLLADSYYPGWHAYIDGKEANILPANLNQRAILLPKGKHKVTFKYVTRNSLLGFLVTGTGYVVIISLLVFDVRTSFLDTISRKLKLFARL